MTSEDNTAAKPSAGGPKTAGLKPPEQTLKCPRCDSPNTKFCYYNNYSLTQPRHFCKTCRRYWTKGGALRNVPIGGGCRKNKKTKVPSSSSSTTFSGEARDGLKFFHGLSPAMDFHLGGGYNNNYNYNQFSLSSNPCLGMDNLGSSSNSHVGFSFPLLKQGESGGFGQEMGINIGQSSNNIASSIESLSSINQDLHWKLQQQRLAGMIFGGQNGQKESTSSVSPQKPLLQPIMFQNLEISKPAAGVCGDDHQVGGNYSRKEGEIGNLATEWYFDGSNYAAVNPNPANISSNGNQGTNNSWSGIQAWTHDLNQYTSGLP